MSAHVNRVYVDGFKRFTGFSLALNPSFNVIVGDNETGKTSLLEALRLVLTGQYESRMLQYALDPYLFNESRVAQYFEKRQNGENADPPKIEIEAYFSAEPDDHDMAQLQGSNNTRSEDCPGLVLTVEVDKDYVDALKDYAADKSNPTVLPVEFYKSTWRSFSGNVMLTRRLPFRTATIDTNLTRPYRGPNRYLSELVGSVLSEDQRRDLSLAYKKLHHQFTREPGVAAINEHLKEKGNAATTKNLTIQMDMSSRTSWDSAISAHLDNLPYDCAGRGEQSRVQMRLAIAGAERARVLLVEEPENHLSHSNLNRLMEDIRRDCADRQVIITTHSAFVLNKLGLVSWNQNSL